MSSEFRRLPAVHRLMETVALRSLIESHGRDPVREACRKAIDGLRARMNTIDDLEAACQGLPDTVKGLVESGAKSAYVSVINATGVMLHTNLGRAPTTSKPVSTYLTLEYDLETGQRGQRLTPLRERIAGTCGAEWAVMVNNNAASLLLILSALAKNREVIVSRGELIEIGGSFRLPSVMEASGSRLCEVGCTNRTHLRDYELAINENTAAILVAHQSNFRIVGFTTSPSLTEVADLAHRHNLPLIVDQGSGCLHDLRLWGLPHEETVGEILKSGADIVCFSGDKLLGGPQAGIIVGDREWIEPLGRHPLYRALRPDKTALIAMDETLVAHHGGKLERIPLYAMLSTTLEMLKGRALRLGRRLRQKGIPARGREMRSALGGGTTPDETMVSYGLYLDGGQRLADLLREQEPPIVARIESDKVLFDLRTVFPDQDRRLEASMKDAYIKLQEIQSGGA